MASEAFYEIRVEGELGDMWAAWFEGISIRKESGSGSTGTITVLSGTIADQPALHALLDKIRDLNLALVSVHKYDRKPNAQEATSDGG